MDHSYPRPHTHTSKPHIYAISCKKLNLSRDIDDQINL